MKKQWNELTPQGQKARITKYNKELKQLGEEKGVNLQNRIFKVVQQRNKQVVTFRNLKDGAKQATLRLLNYDDGEKWFVNANVYIKPGKEALEQFYATLERGELLSVDYVEVKPEGQQTSYLNIWQAFKRQPKTA